MKLSYLFTVTVVLSLVACKKEKQVNSTTDTIGENDYTICSQQRWTTGIASEGIGYDFYFVIDDKFYAFKNINGDVPGDDVVQIYDGTSWTVKPCDIPMGTNHKNFAFAIGSKGYAAICVGTSRFYEYNPVTNDWTRKADFPGEATSGFARFTIGNKGYVVAGTDNADYTNEVWEYNATTNAWRERKSLFLNRAYAIGFSIGNKGYITNGTFPQDLGYYHSLVEYNPTTNEWTEKADFPGVGRTGSQCFVIGNNAYVGAGIADGNTPVKDFYKYSPSSNSWTRILDIPASGWVHLVGFTMNSKGYIEYDQSGPRLAKYSPEVCTTVLTGPIPNVNN